MSNLGKFGNLNLSGSGVNAKVIYTTPIVPIYKDLSVNAFVDSQGRIHPNPKTGSSNVGVSFKLDF